MFEPLRFNCEKTYLVTYEPNKDSNQPRICAVWSDSLLSAWKKQNMPSQYSDQIVRKYVFIYVAAP